MKQIQSYTYTIPANGSVQIPATNDNFIVQAATGPVTVRGDTFGTLPSLVAGQGLKAVPFSRLELKDESGAPNQVTLLLSPAEFVNQVFSGSVAIVGGVLTDTQLRAQAVGVRTAEAPTGDWKQSGGIASNTPQQIVAPGANVNGLVLLAAGGYDYIAGVNGFTFLAKATPPAGIIDGEILLMSQITAYDGAGTFKGCVLPTPQFIAAGLGLYFVASYATNGGSARHARYRLL